MSTPIGSLVRPWSASSVAILSATSSAIPAAGIERAAQRRDAGPGPLLAVEPGVVELMVPGRRAEVPDDGLAAAGKQREADQLVHRPRPDVGGRHVPDVREVEGQQGTELGALELVLEPLQPFLTQPVEVDPLLPVHGVGAKRTDRHPRALPSVESRRRRHRRDDHGLACTASPYAAARSQQERSFSVIDRQPGTEGRAASHPLEDEPHPDGRFEPVVPVAVRPRGIEADGVARRQPVLVEAQRQHQRAGRAGSRTRSRSAA